MPDHVRGSFEWDQINQLCIAGIKLRNSSFPVMLVFFVCLPLPPQRGSAGVLAASDGAGNEAGASIIRLTALAQACAHSLRTSAGVWSLASCCFLKQDTESFCTSVQMLLQFYTKVQRGFSILTPTLVYQELITAR